MKERDNTDAPAKPEAPDGDYFRAFSKAYPVGAVIDFSRGCDPFAGDAAVQTMRENRGRV